MIYATKPFLFTNGPDPVIGNGNLVGVTPQILNHLFCAEEWLFGKYYPGRIKERFHQFLVYLPILLPYQPAHTFHVPGAEHFAHGFYRNEEFSFGHMRFIWNQLNKRLMNPEGLMNADVRK